MSVIKGPIKTSYFILGFEVPVLQSNFLLPFCDTFIIFHFFLLIMGLKSLEIEKFRGIYYLDFFNSILSRPAV